MPRVPKFRVNKQTQRFNNSTINNSTSTSMTPEEYREEGINLYDEDMAKAIECFKKAAEGKDIVAAVSLAAYYYEEEDDPDTAKEWLKKSFKWYEEAGQPEEPQYAIALGHTLMGRILYYDEDNPAMAFMEFAKGEEEGDANAYEYLGKLLYEGDFTPDGNPDVNGAIGFWMQGMEKGDEYCTELYEEHKDEIRHDPKEIAFKNGDHYNGDVNAEGHPNGSGHMDYNLNGYFGEYDGLWSNGKRCGKGHYHQVSKGGRRYVYDYNGEWLDDKEHGYGTAMNSSEKGVHCATVSETYTGEFREGKRHGHGVIVEDNFDGSFRDGQNRFEGEFVDGKIVGHGAWDYANGDRFEGEFVNGYKNGHGIYTFANGLKFEGEWKDNVFLIDTYQADSSQETPVLLVTEHHHGFDYNYTGTFLIPAQKGVIRYDEAATIWKDSSFNMRDADIKITKVTPDSVSYIVKERFRDDDKSPSDTIHRGETKEYKYSRKCTATIYDDDYDYTIENWLKVSCQ